jgi:glycosyltransferase involved in cell wall biosynthesis
MSRLVAPAEQTRATTDACRFTTQKGGRVLVVARWPLGGIRTHLQYNFPTLTAAGYRCTFVGPDDGTLTTLRQGLARVGPAEYVAVPLRGRRCRLWLAARRLLRTGAFDVLHSHGLTAACHCEFARFGLGIPHVATMHEPLRAAQFRGLLGRLKRCTLGRVLRRTDALVTVSGDARENLLESLPALRARAERIVAIPNGVDARRYAAPGRSAHMLRRELGLSAEVPLIGFFGRFMPEKGFTLLIEAIRRLSAEPDAAAFHVVAFGSGDYRREYAKLIDLCRLVGRVTVRDFVPDIAPVLRQLDLVVVPSLWEASSLLSMESMCAGVPVLGSDCPGLREVLHGTPSRTFRSGDPDALRHALRGALESPWTAAARSFASAARERFDVSSSARRLVELYESLRGQATAETRFGWTGVASLWTAITQR